MYNDVGESIKRFAKLAFIFEAIVFIIVGIVLMANEVGGDSWVVLGPACMIGGPFIAFISSLFIYGFGEIIDKLSAIERNTRKPMNMQYRNGFGVEERARVETTEPKNGVIEERAENEGEGHKQQGGTEPTRRIEKPVVQTEIPFSQKTLSQKVKYALSFETDTGMIYFLKRINDPEINQILAAPKEQIRSLANEFLEKIQ